MNIKSQTRLITLGVITSVHGVRGQVKIRSFTEYPEDLIAYGDLQNQAGRIFKVTITGQNQDVLIASIEGITDRDQAEKLKTIELCVPRSALPAPDEDEYYYEDLVGLNVIDEQGNLFGEVTAINNFGAGDIIYIKTADGKDELFQFNKATFPKIDFASGNITIVPPEIVKSEILE